jgi:hypothetical protein
VPATSCRALLRLLRYGIFFRGLWFVEFARRVNCDRQLSLSGPNTETRTAQRGNKRRRKIPGSATLCARALYCSPFTHNYSNRRTSTAPLRLLARAYTANFCAPPSAHDSHWLTSSQIRSEPLRLPPMIMSANTGSRPSTHVRLSTCFRRERLHSP